MGEPTDDEPNDASSPTPAPRGDSIAAAASRALRAKKPTAAGADAPTAATAPAKPDQPSQRTEPAKPAKQVKLAKPVGSASVARPTKPAAETGTKPKPKSDPPAKAEPEPSVPVKAKTAAAGPTRAVAKPADRPAEPAAPPARDAQPRWLGRRALLIYALVAGLLAAAAIVTGVLAATTKQNSDLAFDEARNAVVVDATKDIQTLNALDYRSAAAGINAWLLVSTGSLHDDVTAQRTAILSEVAQKKTVTSATVLSLAVTQLDDRSGSATVMTSVEQIVTPAGQAAVKKFDRFAADLTRIDGSWKIQSITLVPV